MDRIDPIRSVRRSIPPVPPLVRRRDADADEQSREERRRREAERRQPPPEPGDGHVDVQA